MSKKQSGESAGPAKGEFIEPPEVQDEDERGDALPKQEEHWRPPARFGSVPVEKEPLGWHRYRGFRKLFPRVSLPFQVIERVEFGHRDLEPNRLFWGDNLHIMRQLKSESIDLIYLDPPFFSGRNYNVIFGDQNELRSFTDIWEGGMPGYLIWLNARLYEMKRLLKKTGSIYVHCDWHASHYIKVEMDKIFGHKNFRNEIIWKRDAAGKGGKRVSRQWPRVTDTILFYSKGDEWTFKQVYRPLTEKEESPYRYVDGATGKLYKAVQLGNYSEKSIKKMEEQGLIHTSKKSGKKYKKYFLDDAQGTIDNIWQDVPGFGVRTASKERVGYPTQKPETLLERIIQASSNEGDVVADFFIGGGSTVATAQRLNRRWIACDQSRVAVAVTRDRLTQQVEEQTGAILAVPDFTVEHWGVYEAHQLSEAPPDQFRAFVLTCFGAKPEKDEEGVHGYKHAVPVWVGGPKQDDEVTAKDVQTFANAIRQTARYKHDGLRDGIMLAWAFRSDAIAAAESLREQEQTDLNFIRLDMVRIDSFQFRKEVSSLSTDHADYETFLTFVQPPQVEVGYKRISSRTYNFDVSDTVVLNADAKIINVQWDFDHGKHFSSTSGYSFLREGDNGAAEQVQYEFPKTGRIRIACKVQDDKGGEGFWVGEIEVR